MKGVNRDADADADTDADIVSSRMDLDWSCKRSSCLMILDFYGIGQRLSSPVQFAQVELSKRVWLSHLIGQLAARYAITI